VEADAREGRGEAPGGQGVIFIILSLLMMSFGVLVFAPGVALPPVGVRGEGRRGHVVVANPRKRNVRRFLATHATSALPLQHALHLILYYLSLYFSLPSFVLYVDFTRRFRSSFISIAFVLFIFAPP
jgi:hypothetical protein